MQVQPAHNHPTSILAFLPDANLRQLPVLLALGIQQRRDSACLPRLRRITLKLEQRWEFSLVATKSHGARPAACDAYQR